MQATVLGKTFSDISKNGLFGSNQDLNVEVDKARNALSDYFEVVKNGKAGQEELSNYLKDTSANFRNYISGLDSASISVENLNGIMNGFRATQTLTAKAMTLVQNAGLKLLTTLGSMAVTFAVSAAANALVKYLTDIAEAEEKARDAAIDSGKELDNQTSSIDSYKTKISDLKESLDSGTLSEQDAYAAKKELISIQDELVQKYPEEASGIDLVNGSLETQLQLLQGISDEKARAYLDDPENAAAISAAQNAVGNRSYNLVRGSNFDLDASEEELTKIKELAEAQGMDWDSDTITYKFKFTGDASEAENAFTKFIDSVKNDNTIDDKTKEALGGAVTSAKSILADAINNDSDLAELGAKYQIQTNETWSKIYSDLEDARKSYNDAVAADDDEAIALALKKVKSAKDAYLNDTTGFADSYAGNVYTQKLIDQLDSATKLQAVQTGLSETFKGATSNYKSLNDYLNVTDHKAEQLTDSIAYNLNELKGLDDIDILNIGSLEKAGSASKNYTDEQIASYNRLKGVADQLGITIDDLVDIFVKVGLVTSDNIKYTNEFTSSALTMATAASKAVSSVTSILNSQGTGVNVDTDSYSELIKDNAEYAAALQYSNGTMQLNREMTQKLTDAKVKESEAIIKVAYSQNQYKYQEVRSDLSKYTDEVRKSIETDADRLKQFDEEKAALESQSEALRENCRNLQMQYSALMQASSAYQDWLNAQNATESGDMYDSAIEAKKTLAEGLKNGKIGTVKWQAASEFLIPDDYEGTAAEYIKKLNRYFKQASDGSDDGSGINNFITDSLKAGLMKQEKDGSIQILADKTTEDFAKALKLSPDAVQSIFGEMQEYGWTFDWGSMLGDPITNYQMQLEDLQDQMKNLDPDSEEWQVVNEQAEQLQNTLDGLMQRSGLDQLADVVADANEQGKGFSTEVQSAANALQDASRVQLAIDVSDAKDAITEAQKNLDSNKTLENYDALQKAEEEYNKLLQKKEQVGDPTQVEIDMYLKEDTSDGTTVSEKIKNLQKAGLIQVPVESDDSQLQQAADELDTLKNKAADPVKITADSSDAMTKISNLGTAISNLIKDYTINIKVNQSRSNSGSSGKNQKSTPYVAKYHGINGAYGGAFAGGRTLVGELGNELVVNPHSGKWYTVGDNGAEFVNLPKDAIVFDHSKTKKLLDQGFIGGRGVALASGTAMDSGSPGRGSYVGGNGYKVGQDPRVKSTYKATKASTKATKDNTTALEENKKALEKQKTALEKQKDALEKESNKLKIYGQAAINEIEKRIAALNKEKDAQDKVYESQIKELEKRKTALQKANDEEDRAIKLAELQDALEKAKANRTVRIYNKNEGFVWRADQEEVNDAQTDLDDQKRQWKNDDVLQAVDDEIERINNLKDAYDESIEAQIEDLEAMKDKWNEVISLIGTSWEDYQLGLEAAAHFQNMSLDGMGKDLVGYKDNVLANMQEIGGVTDQIDSITESIEQLDEAIQNAKDSSSSGGGSGGGDASDGFGVDDGSTISDDLFDGLSDSAKAAKEELDELLERYEDLGDRNEGLSESQLALVDSISKMTVGTKEYSMANMELSDIQSIVGDRYTEMGNLAEQYRESVLTNNELTWEQKDALLSSFDEIVASYSTGYDTIDGLMQNYMDTLVSNTELSTADYQAQMDALVAFADQHGVSYDSVIQYLYNTEEELRNTGATTGEVSSAMSSAVSAACSAMNASYDSVIAKLVELKKQQAAIKAYKGAAGGINANTVARYATGVIGAATTHIAITDEQGPEIKLRKPAAGNYSLVERGTSIIPAEPSANIWKMGLDPDSFISQHMPQRSIKSVEITQPDAGGVSVSVGDIQMYGVNDVESFGRVIHERVGTIFAQEFSRR